MASWLDTNSYTDAIACTPADNVPIVNKIGTPKLAKGFVAGSNGIVNVLFSGSVTAIAIPVITGYVYNVQIQCVQATGTTATGIVLFFN